MKTKTIGYSASILIVFLAYLYIDRISRPEEDDGPARMAEGRQEGVQTKNTKQKRNRTTRPPKKAPINQGSIPPPASIDQAPIETAPETPISQEVIEYLSKPTPYSIARRTGDDWVSQGDVLVPEEQLVAVEGDSRGLRVVQYKPAKLWQDGIVPYIVDGIDEHRIELALDQISDATAVQFVPMTDEADYVVFEPTEEVACYSYLGRQGGAQAVKLHTSCSQGKIMHELMHVLGFVHEQSREDRDEYLTIHWQNIKVDRKDQFQVLSTSLSDPANLPFDFDSIMLYPSTAFSNNGLPTISKRDGKTYQANRNELSNTDILKIDALYGP